MMRFIVYMKKNSRVLILFIIVLATIGTNGQSTQFFTDFHKTKNFVFSGISASDSFNKSQAISVRNAKNYSGSCLIFETESEQLKNIIKSLMDSIIISKKPDGWIGTYNTNRQVSVTAAFWDRKGARGWFFSISNFYENLRSEKNNTLVHIKPKEMEEFIQGLEAAMELLKSK